MTHDIGNFVIRITYVETIPRKQLIHAWACSVCSADGKHVNIGVNNYEHYNSSHGMRQTLQPRTLKMDILSVFELLH